MSIVITSERASADGLSPKDLIVVAQWHEERAALIVQSMGPHKKKRKPLGDASDVDRHGRLAAELRDVAFQMINAADVQVAA